MAAPTHIDATIKIGGEELPKGGDKDNKGSEIFALLVESDLDQPDHACVTLANNKPRYSQTINEGDDFEVKLGFADGKQSSQVVFSGEVTGIEPIFAEGDQRVNLRGLSHMHKLTRGKKSVAHTNASHKDIVEKVCQAQGLKAKFGDSPPTSKLEHVYQHNQTDLEFLRECAARCGCEVRVDHEKNLYFAERTDEVSEVKLVLGGKSGESTLERFMPRLSTANQVSKVIVRGWDPEKKKVIIGTAEPQTSKLGDEHGSKVLGQKHSDVELVVVNVPVRTKEEADAYAKSVLQKRLMSFITGEGVARGNPAIKPGIVVEVDVGDDRFNGKYYITAIRHRYVHGGTSGGFRTEFKFSRDARNKA